MERYGFFGGSFNPVTNAHTELALDIIRKYNLDKIIFVPIGNWYNKKDLADEKHRYNMLNIAVNEYSNLEISNIELNSNKSLTTLEAFKKIENNYKNIEKYYIMGADNINKMILSKDLETLSSNYKYIIIERNFINVKELINKNEILLKNKSNFIIMKNEDYTNTSSTDVRDKLKQNKKTDLYSINENVLNYIKENRLYM